MEPDAPTIENEIQARDKLVDECIAAFDGGQKLK